MTSEATAAAEDEERRLHERASERREKAGGRRVNCNCALVPCVRVRVGLGRTLLSDHCGRQQTADDDGGGGQGSALPRGARGKNEADKQ